MALNSDKIIKCPKSGGHLCYVNKINGDVTVYNSLSCGFMTNSLMIKDHQFYKEQMEALPELYKDLAWTDPKTNLVWIPTGVNIEGVGMIFAEGTSVDNWKWAAVPFIPVENEEEKEAYKSNFKPDNDNKLYFEEGRYISALMYLKIIPTPNNDDEQGTN